VICCIASAKLICAIFCLANGHILCVWLFVIRLFVVQCIYSGRRSRWSPDASPVALESHGACKKHKGIPMVCLFFRVFPTENSWGYSTCSLGYALLNIIVRV
jgi:hypothetical protein